MNGTMSRNIFIRCTPRGALLDLGGRKNNDLKVVPHEVTFISPCEQATCLEKRTGVSIISVILYRNLFLVLDKRDFTRSLPIVNLFEKC